jgi:hypothetical protein
MELHAAENRGYRELYAFARNIAVHWPKLADRVSGSSAQGALRDGAEGAEQLLRDLEGRTPDYGLYGKPAAQSLGANIGRARRDVRDRFLERNQAVRMAVLDMQHVVTLLGYLEEIARTRSDESLVGFCSAQRERLLPLEQRARAAAIELGSNPDEAIEPLDDSTAGRVAHGTAYAFGSFGEWLDRRVSNG